jgi:hypothetical protein
VLLEGDAPKLYNVLSKIVGETPSEDERFDGMFVAMVEIVKLPIALGSFQFATFKPEAVMFIIMLVWLSSCPLVSITVTVWFIAKVS